MNEEFKNKIFLGGTCGTKFDWDWRRSLIPKLPDGVTYYDPFLRDWETDKEWDEEAQKAEIRQRECCEYTCYIITSDFSGIYSFCEAVADSCTKQPGKVIVGFIDYNGKIFRDGGLTKSIEAWLRLCESHGAKVVKSTDEVAIYLKSKIDSM